MIERPMTEDEMQACLDAGDLPGTPSEARAIERAFALGRRRRETDGGPCDCGIHWLCAAEHAERARASSNTPSTRCPWCAISKLRTRVEELEAKLAGQLHSDATTQEGTRSR